jgi:hypothetical protein
VMVKDGQQTHVKGSCGEREPPYELVSPQREDGGAECSRAHRHGDEQHGTRSRTKTKQLSDLPADFQHSYPLRDHAAAGARFRCMYIAGMVPPPTACP